MIEENYESIYENEWLSLRKLDDYIYSHETRCNGKIVAILPFIPEPFQYIARYEATPCIENDQIRFCSITGGVEENNVEGTVIMELKEEAGIIAKESELIKLGTIYPSKSQDTVVYLFGIDITGKEIGEATGDGSNHETNAYVKLENDISKLITCKDPLNVVMFSRLLLLKRINLNLLE